MPSSLTPFFEPRRFLPFCPQGRLLADANRIAHAGSRGLICGLNRYVCADIRKDRHHLMGKRAMERCGIFWEGHVVEGRDVAGNDGYLE